MRFAGDVRVAAGEREVDAKSLLSVLALGASRGTLLRLRAEGPDAADAVQTLAAAVAGLPRVAHRRHDAEIAACAAAIRAIGIRSGEQET